MTCPTCSAENPPGSRFCAQCGVEIAAVCSACGASNPVGSRYCTQCGAALGMTTPPPRAGQWRPSRAPNDTTVPSLPSLAGEQRRTVTVVFADIVGFTSLADRLDPEVVRDVTAACFGRLVEEVARRGGTVDKFIGDAIMALFGTPVAHEDDPSRAVDAALAMQAALGEINGELERDHGLRLELRIGVNTGEVVAGVRQVAGIGDATVIGDTVNVAARLQRAAPPGAVFVGEATARLAQQAFELESLAPLTLRGKSEPVAAFRAVGPLAEPAVPDAASLPLVGRAAEVAALAASLDRLAAGRGRAIVLTGDPGVGKSRLLGELRRRVQADGRLRWAEAQAAAYGPGQTYKMYATWARALFGEELHDPEADPDGAVARLADRLERLDVREVLPYICDLLGLPLEEQARTTFGSLPQEEIHRRGVRAVTRLHRALAVERPTVIALDDLQWADPTVIGFLEAAIHLTAEVPLLFCFSFRPDRDAPCWPLRERAAALGPDGFLEVQLGPLSDDDTRMMIRGLLGGEPLSPVAERGLLARVEGNPLFAHELVQTLVERRALVQQDGGDLDLDRGLSERVPDTLQATILARVDRLPEEARHVVQTAAVLGRTFSRALLGRVAGDGPALERGVREVIRSGLFRERQAPRTLGYSFTQGLVQEVAERTLLVRRRKELHRAAVAAIEALYADELSAHAAGLVRHAVAGELWDAAMGYARLAAEQAIASHATREALRFYELGLHAAERLGPDAPVADLARLLAGRGAILGSLGRFDEAADAIRAALDAASGPDFVGDGELEPARFRARLALNLANAYIQGLRVDNADRAGLVAFANLRDGQPELTGAWCIRSWVEMQRGDLAASADSARTALRLALACGGFEERTQAYGALTKPALAGQIGPSIATYAEEAVRLVREHAHEGFLFDALINREVLRLICLQPYVPEALENAREALAIARTIDSVPAIAAAQVVLGATRCMGGDWEAAEATLTLLEAVGAPMPMVTMMRKVAVALLWTARGHADEARTLLEEAEGALPPHGGVWVRVILATSRARAGDAAGARLAIAAAEAERSAWHCLACTAVLGGYGSEVLAELGDPRALDLAALADRGFPLAQLLARRARAVYLLGRGEWEAALSAAEGALPLAVVVGQPYQEARVRYVYGLALAGVGERDASRAAVKAALATFERLGAEPDAAAARATLAREDEASPPLPLASGRGPGSGGDRAG